MVGLMTLDHLIGVRVPAIQPIGDLMSRNVVTADTPAAQIAVAQEVTHFGPYTNVEGSLDGYPIWTAPTTRNSLVRISLYVGCATVDVAPQSVTIRAEASDPYGNVGKVQTTVLAPNAQSGATGVMWVAYGSPIKLYIDGVLASR